MLPLRDHATIRRRLCTRGAGGSLRYSLNSLRALLSSLRFPFQRFLGALLRLLLL